MTAAEAEKRKALERLKRDFFLPPLLENKYAIQKIIGEGAYGVVCSATDTHTNETVAVKRIMRVFDAVPEAVRILRELKFLRVLRDHENIITTRDVLLPSNRDTFNDVFVVFDLMPADLNRVLRSKIALSNEHIRWLIYQLIRGVAYLHRAKVFHRDLKPSNVLINSECDLVICDFGLARASLGPQQDTAVFWTDYVATRWYRAPELIMCASGTYTAAIDMWSCGCIFAEMLNSGKTLFPGLNSIHQLELIVNTIGYPSRAAISAIQDPTTRDHLIRMERGSGVPFSKLLPNADPGAIMLLEQLLQFDPAMRLNAEEALRHPYFADLHHEDLPNPPPVPLKEFSFESENLTREQIRRMFLEEILMYHPEKRHLFLSQSPTLDLKQDQAARFRNDMRDVQITGRGPAMFKSMPNRELNHFYAGAGGILSHAPGNQQAAYMDQYSRHPYSEARQEVQRAAYAPASRGGHEGSDENVQMEYEQLPSTSSVTNGVLSDREPSARLMSVPGSHERMGETVDSMECVSNPSGMFVDSRGSNREEAHVRATASVGRPFAPVEDEDEPVSDAYFL